MSHSEEIVERCVRSWPISKNFTGELKENFSEGPFSLKFSPDNDSVSFRWIDQSETHDLNFIVDMEIWGKGAILMDQSWKVRNLRCVTDVNLVYPEIIESWNCWTRVEVEIRDLTRVVPPPAQAVIIPIEACASNPNISVKDAQANQSIGQVAHIQPGLTQSTPDSLDDLPDLVNIQSQPNSASIPTAPMQIQAANDQMDTNSEDLTQLAQLREENFRLKVAVAQVNAELTAKSVMLAKLEKLEFKLELKLKKQSEAENNLKKKLAKKSVKSATLESRLVAFSSKAEQLEQQVESSKLAIDSKSSSSSLMD